MISGRGYSKGHTSLGKALYSKSKFAQSCLTLCDPMDYTVHGILHARILEWVAFPSSRGSSQPRDRTQVSCIAGRFFTSWATREAQGRIKRLWNRKKQLLGVQSAAATAAKSLQSCLTVQPHRWQPIRLSRPWDSPGKNTGVGCHFLPQCIKVKNEVA